MNQQLMRRLDAWVGKLICLLLTFHCKVTESLSRRKPLKSILFIKLIEQGASVLAVDAFERAIELVGYDNVYLCVFTENRPIIDVLGQVKKENVFALRNQNITVFAIDLIKMLWRARRLGISATVDLEFFSRGSAIISYLTGAKHRVGLHRYTMDGPYRGDLMTHRIAYNPYLHTAVTYRVMVDALTLPVKEVPFNKIAVNPESTKKAVFRPDPADISAVESLLAERCEGFSPHGLRIILNPNASDLMPLRKWPTDRFKKLAEQILDEYPDALVILTGAPREAAPAEKIRDEIGSKRVISVAGATTMPQLITLFGLCDVLVTNDSGPAHFASMTKIKNIVLFGPETPKLYGPIDGNPMPIWAGLACSPCINALNHRLSPCNNNLCMQVISVDEVMQKVRQSINGRQPGASFQQESTLPTGRYIAQSNIGGDAHVL